MVYIVQFQAVIFPQLYPNATYFRMYFVTSLSLTVDTHETMDNSILKQL